MCYTNLLVKKTITVHKFFLRNSYLHHFIRFVMSSLLSNNEWSVFSTDVSLALPVPLGEHKGHTAVG